MRSRELEVPSCLKFLKEPGGRYIEFMEGKRPERKQQETNTFPTALLGPRIL